MFFNLFKKSDKSEADKVNEASPETAVEVQPDVSEILDETLVENKKEPFEASAEVVAEAPVPAEPAPTKLGFFARIKQGLSRTSSHFAEGLGNLFLGRKSIDEDLFEELETQLLLADVGMEATSEIIDNLTARVARKQLNDADALYKALRDQLADLLKPVEQPLVVDSAKAPFVILVVGVNGVGKTTTIGKLAKRLQNEGKKVMLAAGDTFRAAAVEQLQVWGERNNVPVIAQHTGADSASVIYDALNAAKARGIDVVIADTAGRLHNKNHLMEELAKVKRVMAKLDASAPHEVLLVLDAGTGQNAVNQAEQFRDAAGVTGLVLTKLDGTAKGGVIFALSKKFSLPVRFIGVGESIEDLQPFAAEPFIKALFNQADAN
ncbi:signal recognition particle-docking protein FtsY [Cellvibrio sp. KY-GH-1]|uniref:signal recognition particle-docking protein FtsY n=1 Tax=Cellvibrio sp. KY-GH-1 TaxID=2303332 RepID=UPI0012486A5F|nr:signal recognition particle-docking protein FtsY [Cellvibrio sp. KY-GH-1]QEY17381.1 signal recognition particle-docking protein FtsY [Cellvibrio sp. KY-GH-1]